MMNFLKKHWKTSLLFLILGTGLCLLLYPLVSDWWNSFHQSRAIASYQKTVEEMSDRELDDMLKAAAEYNERLLDRNGRQQMTQEELEEYEKLLDPDGTGIMGYVRIPSIDVDLPIYHGTGEDVLQVAVGHISWTSLPIGGEGTHCAISGHRGLPSARLFTDLDKVREGDVFTLTVLGRVATYRVDQIKTVLPEELEGISIMRGEDHCTLVTCTPYGLNTHRLLVRGTRIENVQESEAIVNEVSRISAYLVIPAVGIPLLFLLLLAALFYYSVKPVRRDPRKALEEYGRERLRKDASADEKSRSEEEK